MALSKESMRSLREKEVERFIGIEGYSSSSPGIGGIIKEKPEDFKTWEILTNGLNARTVFESWRRYESGYGRFTLCVLKKIGVDTIRASSMISRILRLKPKDLGFCGIKDKTSISWQFMSLPSGVMKKEGIKVNGVIEVKPVEDTNLKLSTRMLLKNLFEVRIKYVERDAGLIGECLAELRDKGVPNFFGHQRFGLTRPITPIVGKLIMEGRLEEAVKAFLTEYSPLEGEVNRRARVELAESWDLMSALQTFPKALRYERDVIRYLLGHAEDYSGALRALPLRLRRLFVESVAALAFNKALSRIMAQDGLMEPEIGDFVVPVGLGGRVGKRPIQVRPENIEAVRRMIRLRRAVIALPVPGYLSSIPRNWKGEELMRALNEIGVSLEMFRVQLLPESSTRGSLRSIAVPGWRCDVVSHKESELVLELSLPPGSYATIILREIMKPLSPFSFIGMRRRNERERRIT